MSFDSDSFLDREQKFWTKISFNGITGYAIKEYVNYKWLDEETLQLINSDPSRMKYDYVYGNNRLMSIRNEEHSLEYLPAGKYKLIISSGEWALVEFDISSKEDTLNLGPITEITDDFLSFINNEHVYRNLKTKYKRSILLYGPPGTGKTTSINHLITKISQDNSLIIFVNDNIPYELAINLKRDPRLKIFIFEELTELTEHHTERLLNFLDGELSLDNQFIIATTNYPEKLPSNVVNRPGRFDKFYHLGFLSKKDIIKYWETKVYKLDTTEKNFFHKNMTLAELKEIAVIVLRDKLSLQKALNMLSTQKDLIAKNFKQQERDDEDYIL